MILNLFIRAVQQQWSGQGNDPVKITASDNPGNNRDTGPCLLLELNNSLIDTGNGNLVQIIRSPQDKGDNHSSVRKVLPRNLRLNLNRLIIQTI